MTGNSLSVLSALRTCIPDKRVAAVTSASSVSFALPDQELAGTRNFSDKRLREFTAGRYCAHGALAQIGRRDQSVPIGESRQPIWPSGVVGSIAHTSTIAAAIVTESTNYSGLGLDIEELQDLDDLAAQICTNSERTNSKLQSLDGRYLNVVFSAKEAIYKCLWPMVRRFIGFHEIEIEINAETFKFFVSYHDNLLDRANDLQGSWRFVENKLIAVAVLPTLR